MPSALVIGGTGFLGHAIVQELLSRFRVSVLSRGRMPRMQGNIDYLTGDRTVTGGVSAAISDRSFDLVVDCIGFQKLEIDDAVAALRGRVGHYIFISTDFVYAADPSACYPLTEDAAKVTDLPYGLGKLACEAALVDAWSRQKFPATILRPPHLVGAGSPLGCSHITQKDPHLVENLRSGKSVPLLAEGMILIQPVWTHEVGQAIAHMAGKAATFGQILNCPGPQCVTMLGYYQIIAELLGVELKIERHSAEQYAREHPDRAHVVRHRIYSDRRLRECSGYIPSRTLREAFTQTLQWMQQRG